MTNSNFENNENEKVFMVQDIFSGKIGKK